MKGTWPQQGWRNWLIRLKLAKAEYQDYICLIEPKGSFLTPLQADTLWAALVWAHRYLHGAKKTEKFVHHNPPKLIISDGFPYNFLPRPRCFIPVQRVKKIIREEFAGDDWEKYLIGIEIAKKLAQKTLLHYSLVNHLLNGGSEEDILKDCLQVKICPKLFVNHHQLLIGPSVPQKIKRLKDQLCNSDHCDALTCWRNSKEKRGRQLRCAEIRNCEVLFHYQLTRERTLRKNVIHRTQMTALEEDGLYSHREIYLLGELWWIFIRAHAITREEIVELFQFLENYGYGKRKSTGKGQFSFHSVKPLAEHYTVPEVTEPDGFMSLSSSYVPQKGEFKQARYTVHVKRGKVDGHLSTGVEKFLKYPIAMYEAGSVFQADRKQVYYGQFVKGIHPTKEFKLVQYGYTFPLMGKFFNRRNGGNG